MAMGQYALSHQIIPMCCIALSKDMLPSILTNSKYIRQELEGQDAVIY